ncbi:Alpha-xylosidase [Poriferisphaera corsica]|uniref:Alpha-xylosidase n=1 Tax=Poriferisphaera corsica TaxID=2528020 RepID=A0A517YSN2_9BACT|nr:TIM-barrel domain-containing protein [Poriferisphaera corsica]QDU33236.1 Alpha-xylosidase [Poriferisphaera corsica]
MRFTSKLAAINRFNRKLFPIVAAVGCFSVTLITPSISNAESGYYMTQKSNTLYTNKLNDINIKIESIKGMDNVLKITAQQAAFRSPVSTSSTSEFYRFDTSNQQLNITTQNAKKLSFKLSSLNAFSDVSDQGLDVSWTAAKGEQIFGLGERFDSFNQAGKIISMWILDAPGQSGGATYFASPTIFSSKGYALFFTDNPKGRFDLNSKQDNWNNYQRAGSVVSFYLVFADTVEEQIKIRTQMIGGLATIPDWAYKPWASKNSYETQEEAEIMIAKMKSLDLPFGAIVLEAWKGHSEKGQFNQVSKERWPDFKSFMENCNTDDIAVILWQVPILHPSSILYPKAVSNNLLVKDPEGKPSLREEWLAGFANYDFTNPEAVQFWQDMLRPLVQAGVKGFKADDGESIKPTDVFYNGKNGVEMHNQYSSLYNQATFDLFTQEKADGLLWARSGSIGIEKAPALWAGDQGASWDQVQSLIPAGLSTSVSGMPFWGHDIGGYFGTASPELYIRWLQLGTLSPLMQFHGIEPREPYNFGDSAIDAYRLLAKLRMNLMPELIKIGKNASKTGIPMMRPLFFEAPETLDTQFTDTQFMLGNDMLVAPILNKGASARPIYFPKGKWLHPFSPIVFEGPAIYHVPINLVDAPLFIRDKAQLNLQLTTTNKLGEWDRSATAKTQTINEDYLYTSDTILKNINAPLTPHPDKAMNRLSFELQTGSINNIQTQYWFASSPDKIYTTPLKSNAQSFVAHLTPETNDAQLSGIQHYQVIDTVSQSILLKGSMDWDAILDITIPNNARAITTTGTHTISTTITNNTAEKLTTELMLKPTSKQLKIKPLPRTIMLKPYESREINVELTVPNHPQNVGDLRATLTATRGNLTLDQQDIILVNPLRWVVAGPIKTANVNDAFTNAFPPQWIPEADATFKYDDQQYRWESIPAQFIIENNGINFNKLFGQTDNAAAYLMTYIDSPIDQPVELRFGSDDTLSVWLNDEPLYANQSARAAAPDQDIIPATLKKGANRLVVKIAQGEYGWEALFRITAPDNQPITNLHDGFVNFSEFNPNRPTSNNLITSPAQHWAISTTSTFEGDTVIGNFDFEKSISTTSPLNQPIFKNKRSITTTNNTIDLINLFGQGSNQVVYANTTLTLKDKQPVTFRSGSDDGLMLWVDGKLVIDAEKFRGYTANEDQATLTLTPGKHQIIARISQGGGDWMFSISAWDKASQPLYFD